MALEANIENPGVYIDSLNDANPAAADGLAQADDHMRGIKNTLLNTFTGVTGEVTATHTELNYTDVTTLGTVEASKAVTADSNAEINMSGGKLQPSVSGTFTTASLTQNSEEETTITHGLGTDDVDVVMSVFGSLSLASGAMSVTATSMAPDKRATWAGRLQGTDPTIVTAPSTGDVIIKARNNSGTSQTVTVKYTITKRS